jgi:flagellar basal-body rod modification protein FlgD
MTAISALNNPAAASGKSAMSALGHGDFLKLMVAQLQQQDPFAPVDNKDMLAQMAQFTALAGSSETNTTLTAIAEKLDLLIAAQTPATPATSS